MSAHRDAFLVDIECRAQKHEEVCGPLLRPLLQVPQNLDADHFCFCALPCQFRSLSCTLMYCSWQHRLNCCSFARGSGYASARMKKSRYNFHNVLCTALRHDSICMQAALAAGVAEGKAAAAVEIDRCAATMRRL